MLPPIFTPWFEAYPIRLRSLVRLDIGKPRKLFRQESKDVRGFDQVTHFVNCIAIVLELAFDSSQKSASKFDGSFWRENKKGVATRLSKISGTLRQLPSVPCLFFDTCGGGRSFYFFSLLAASSGLIFFKNLIQYTQHAPTYYWYRSSTHTYIRSCYSHPIRNMPAHTVKIFQAKLHWSETQRVKLPMLGCWNCGTCRRSALEFTRALSSCNPPRVLL